MRPAELARRAALGLAAVFWAGGVFAGGVQVYAHRGARAYSPENTIPGYKTALRLGTDWVDMDVVLTKDGEVLVSHDLVLNQDITRGADGKFLAAGKDALKALPAAERAEYDSRYAQKNMTLAEARGFDVGRLNPGSAYAKFFPDQVAADGTEMPTLREVVRLVDKASGGEVGFQIELKTDPANPAVSPDPKVFAAALYKVLKEENLLGRSEIQAFDFRCLYELQQLDPRVKTAYLTHSGNERGGSDTFFADDPAAPGPLWTGGKLAKDFGGTIPKMVKTLGGFAWEPEDAELTKDSLDEAHQLGLKVVVWTWPEKAGTAFDPAMAAKLISWGVDGIITDDPARLSSMLAARGFALHKRYKVK